MPKAKKEAAPKGAKGKTDADKLPYIKQEVDTNKLEQDIKKTLQSAAQKVQSSSKNTDSATVSSSSPSTTDKYEKDFKELCLSFGDKNFRDADLDGAFPNLTKQERVCLLNQLIVKDVIEIVNIKSKGQLEYRCKVKQPEGSTDLAGLDKEEKVVYRIIKEAGNKGIWMRDIRFKANILPTQLNKILKSLESKKVIKAVKSVSAYKKKVYMLFELEPDSALTGGSWYCDQDFESEFVDVLNQQCFRFLIELRNKVKENPDNIKKGPLVVQSMSSALPKDVCKFITDLGISKIPLSEEDIRTILDTLVYDGKVERKVTIGGTTVYRAIEPLLYSDGLTVLPCSVCPVVQKCQEDIEITSIKCPYLPQWNEKRMAAAKVRESLGKSTSSEPEKSWFVAGIKMPSKKRMASFSSGLH